MKKSDASYTALALDKNASKHPSFPHRASVLTILLVCFLVAALYLSAPSLGISLPSSLSVDYFTYRSWKTKDLSHFAHYVWHKKLPWNPNSQGRLVVVGDLHGTVKQLRQFLDSISFQKDTDTLLLLGDIVAKHPDIQQSLDTVTFAREFGAYSVRGNHDHDVITFRSLIDHRNLYSADSTWLDADVPPTDFFVPAAIKWKGDHFNIARKLSISDYHYLRSLPLTYHLPELHTFFVHAGLYPTLPENSSDSSSPPPYYDLDLSSSMSLNEFHIAKHLEKKAKKYEDLSVLFHHHNRDPQTLFNMRGIRKSNDKPTRDGDKGTPWHSLWNDIMMGSSSESSSSSSSHQNEAADNSSTQSHKSFSPIHVVYGHWKKRGLELKEWTHGLDSGCVFGKQLSSLIIEPSTSPLSSDDLPDWVQKATQQQQQQQKDSLESPESSESSDLESESTSRIRHKKTFSIYGYKTYVMSMSCPKLI